MEITACPLVGLYDIRTTAEPMLIEEILLPVRASNSAKHKVHQLFEIQPH